MQNNKITNHQLFTLMATISLGGSILVIASTIAGIAGQDAWISALLAVLFGMPVVVMYFHLGRIYPGMTLIGICRGIFGKWLGFAVSLGYVLLFISTATHVPWYIGSYFGSAMHQTPAYFINIFFTAALVIAVLYGIETIARVSEIFILVVSAFFIISMVLLTKNIHFENALPIMEQGVTPSLKGSYFLSCYITFSAITIMMVFPRNVNDIAKAKKAMLKGLIWSGTISFVTISMTILVLGSALTARSSFPTLLLATEINVGLILTRMEYIISVMWLLTHFMVSVIFLYASVTGLAELLGLKDHLKIVLPMGLLVLVMSGIVYPNAIYQASWDNMVYVPYITTFGFVIPFIMMVVNFVKKRFFNIL